MTYRCVEISRHECASVRGLARVARVGIGLRAIGVLAVVLVALSGGLPAAAEAQTTCPPSLQEGPTVYPGQTVALTAADSCGNALPSGTSIQWQLSTDGGDTYANIPGATSQTVVATITLDAAGNDYFRASYTNASGSGTSPIFEYEFYAVPQLASVEAPLGTTATFNLDGGGLATGATVDWEISTDGGATWSDLGAQTGPGTGTLDVPVTSASQNGDEYEAVITDSGADGSVTAGPATLSVGPSAATGPIITQQPADTPTPCVGGAATFTAASYATPTATVQWQVSSDGGSTWSNDTTDAGATTDTLTVTISSSSQTGNEYRAVFTNPAGSVTSSAASLTTGAPAVIEQQPAGQDAAPTQTVTYTVLPSPCYGPASVQWQVQTPSAGNNNPYTPIAGATSDTLTVPDITSSDSGNNYEAVVTTGSTQTVSQPAGLYVVNVPTPASQAVLAGSNVTFPAGFGLEETSSWTYQWQVSTDGGNTWTNDTTDASATSDTLSLSDVTIAQNGDVYRAAITDPSGVFYTSAATLTVTTIPPPTITQQPAEPVSCLGGPATITATASGATSVQWQVSTDFGITWSNDTTDSGATTDSLTVTNPGEVNEYRAVFSNSSPIQAITQARIISVEYPPPVGVTPSSETVLAGQTASFSEEASECLASLPVQWQSEAAGASSFTNIAGATSATLTIPGTTTAQSGTAYQVVVGGNGSFSANLTVLALPAPSSVTVAPGASATFSLGTLPSGVTEQWQVSTDGGSTWSSDTADGGATTATLTVASATAAKNGFEYRAAITDSAGTIDTPAATLTVKSANAPTVTSVLPSRGGAYSLVLIRGTNLSRPTSVAFGSVHTHLFLALDSRVLVALAPPQSAGTVHVTVTTARNGTSSTSSADTFTYTN